VLLLSEELLSEKKNAQLCGGRASVISIEASRLMRRGSCVEIGVTTLRCPGEGVHVDVSTFKL
jgi:hypothetical protein